MTPKQTTKLGHPSKPEGLSEAAEWCWDFLLFHIEPNVLSGIDSLLLTRTAKCWGHIAELEALIEKHGHVYAADTHAGEKMLKANPATVQLATQERLFKSYLAELPATPLMRERFKSDIPLDPEDEFEGLLA